MATPMQPTDRFGPFVWLDQNKQRHEIYVEAEDYEQALEKAHQQMIEGESE